MLRNLVICIVFLINIYELGSVLISRYDSRVKAMEVDERPTEQYSDIGGLDQQIQEVNTFINPFTIKISVVFLLTVCHTTLIMLAQRIWYWINR